MKLELEDGLVDYIVKALAKRPYEECYQVIHEIQRQANSQDEPAKLVDAKASLKT